MTLGHHSCNGATARTSSGQMLSANRYQPMLDSWQDVLVLVRTFTIMSSLATKGISVRSVTLPTMGKASTCVG
jgi:hypothetical protein